MTELTIAARYSAEDAHEAAECNGCTRYSPQVSRPTGPHGLLRHEPCGWCFACSRWTDGDRLQPGIFDLYEGVER